MLDTKEKIDGKIDDAADKAKRWTHDVGDKARASGTEPEGPGAGSVAEAVWDKVQDVATGASHLVISGKDTAQEWATAAADAAGQVKDKAVELASTAADKALDLGQDVTRLIRQYPFQALLIGFGVGFGVGFLLTRGRHS